MATFLKKKLSVFGGGKGKKEEEEEIELADEILNDPEMSEMAEEGFLVSESEASRSRAWSAAEKDKLGSTRYPFNEDQLAALEKFRGMIKTELESVSQYEEIASDRRLIRFLRGHKFDFDVATSMFKDMIKWRQEYGADEIRNDIVTRNLEPPGFPAHGRIMRYYPSHIHHGDDKEGHPVHIELVGNVQPRKLLSSFSEEEFIRHHVYCMEYNSLMLDNLTKEKGKLMRIVLVYDLRGIGPGHLKSRHGWDLIKKTLAITQNYYPESMHKCFLLNVPKIFNLGWTLLKPMLAERTQAKIQIFGSNYKKLQDFISPENLPVSLGGTRADEWPLVFDKKQYQVIDEEYKQVDVPKGGKETVQIAVKGNSFVVWGFYTKSGDINVSVATSGKQCQEEEEQKDVSDGEEEVATLVSQHQRHESNGGSFEVSSDTVVTLEFDNSFSWLTKKTVHYYVFSVPCEEKHHLDSPRHGRLTSFFQ